MRASELDAVEAASIREREHAAYLARLGCAGQVCNCTTCLADRVTIAAAAPWLLDYVREGRMLHRNAGTMSGEMP